MHIQLFINLIYQYTFTKFFNQTIIDETFQWLVIEITNSVLNKKRKGIFRRINSIENKKETGIKYTEKGIINMKVSAISDGSE